jgi:DNA-binding XRE family transcriptional regulator
MSRVIRWTDGAEVALALGRRSPRRPLKLNFGPLISEGARQLWLSMKANDWSQADLARALQVKPATVSRWLYGERRPSIALGSKMEQELRIAPRLWSEHPAQPFDPPGLTAARQKIVGES